jgi:hypothetical protein
MPSPRSTHFRWCRQLLQGFDANLILPEDPVGVVLQRGDAGGINSGLVASVQSDNSVTTAFLDAARLIIAEAAAKTAAVILSVSARVKQRYILSVWVR